MLNPQKPSKILFPGHSLLLIINRLTGIEDNLMTARGQRSVGGLGEKGEVLKKDKFVERWSRGWTVQYRECRQ